MVAAVIAAISLPTIFFLQSVAGSEIRYGVYLPWLMILAVASLWSALVPIGVLVMLSSNANFEGLLTATAYIAFGATCLHYRVNIRRHIFSWPTLLFLFFIAISCCWATDPLLWISEYPTFQMQELPLWLLAFSVALIVASDPERFPHLLWIIVGCAMLGSIMIFLNFGTATSKDIYRHQGFGRTDMFAGWPMLACIILVFESINSKRLLIWRGASVCLAVAALAATAFTGAQSAVVGLAAGCLSLVLFSFNIRRNIMAAFILIIIVGAIHYYIPSVSENIEGRFSDKSIETGSGRLVIWEDALYQVFPTAPIVGVGWNNFAQAMDLKGFGYIGAHNVCVQVLVELGVVGFAVFSWWCLSLFWFTRIGAQGQLLRAMLVAVLVQGLFLHPLYCAYFWIVIGLVEGSRRCHAQLKYQNALQSYAAPMPAIKSMRYSPR